MEEQFGRHKIRWSSEKKGAVERPLAPGRRRPASAMLSGSPHCSPPTPSWPGNTAENPSMKATVKNPRGSVEKLSPKESVEGKPETTNPRVRSPPRVCSQVFAREKSRGSPHTAPENSVCPWGTLRRGQLLHSAPRIFNSCSDYQNHEFHWLMKPVLTVLPINVGSKDTHWG